METAGKKIRGQCTAGWVLIRIAGRECRKGGAFRRVIRQQTIPRLRRHLKAGAQYNMK